MRSFCCVVLSGQSCLATILGNVSVACSFVIGVYCVSGVYLVADWPVYSAMGEDMHYGWSSGIL